MGLLQIIGGFAIILMSVGLIIMPFFHLNGQKIRVREHEEYKDGMTKHREFIRDSCVWSVWNGDKFKTRIYRNQLRLATPEEIAEEKQRRWWAKHGRKVWELKVNDEIRHKESDRRFDVVHIFDNGDINMERTSTNNYQQKEVMTVKSSYISNYYYEVVCFAEDRKDVQS